MTHYHILTVESHTKDAILLWLILIMDYVSVALVQFTYKIFNPWTRFFLTRCSPVQIPAPPPPPYSENDEIQRNHGYLNMNKLASDLTLMDIKGKTWKRSIFFKILRQICLWFKYIYIYIFQVSVCCQHHIYFSKPSNFHVWQNRQFEMRNLFRAVEARQKAPRKKPRPAATERPEVRRGSHEELMPKRLPWMPL